MTCCTAFARRTVLLSGAALFVAPAAFAHRSQSVLSSVVWNETNSTIEVIHRIHADDAEIGLAKYANLGEVLDLSEIRNQARLLVYIESHFHLSGPAGAIELEPIGVQPQGREINAYQEAALSERPDELSIDNQILRDIYERQTNLVNVRIAERTRTIIFSGSDKVKRATNLT